MAKAAMRNIEQFDASEIGRDIKRAQRAAVSALKKGEDAASAEVLKLLRDLEDSIRFELARLRPDQFKSFHLSRIITLIDNLIADFTLRATANMDKIVRSSIDLRISSWLDQFQAISKRPGAPTAIPTIASNELMSVTTNMSTELIRGLFDEVRKKTKTTLQRAVLGQKTPFEAAKEISQVVGSRGNVGAGASADRIVRTEVNRAFNVADEFVRREVSDNVPDGVPGLMKIWVTANDGRVRSEHRKAHKQVRRADEPFSVGGESLEYPLDPGGKPGNTINCRCTTITVPADMVNEMLQTLPG